jgi:hypothetical protein
VQSASELQEVLQAPVPQTYGAQLCVDAVEQVPFPAQNAALVRVDPLHDGLPHGTDVDACWQAPLVQRPVLPQVPLAVHPPCGSAVPLATLAQTPVPEMLQAWQVPQALTMQQTLSVQLPLPHSWSAPQLAASAFLAVQVPAGPVQ